MMNFELNSTFISTDVTAIKIINDEVLAGIGSWLHVFSIKNKKCIFKREIFRGQKIHGIVLNGDNLLIYGGRYLTILNYSSLAYDDIGPVADPWVVNDWILTVRWLNNTVLALALSHNVVSLWCSETGKQLRKYTCQEKCILYSALLLQSDDKVILFAGTVFSEVVIWSLSWQQQQIEDQLVWHRLKGHKGVIFCISYDERKRRLLTSSDDRSVRVWDISGPDGWQHCDISEKHILYGHSARVWRVLPTLQGFISAGEDSVLCRWDDEGQLNSKISCAHQGGSIWSLDLDPQQNIIVTGGGDGGISVWPLSSPGSTFGLPALPWQQDYPRRVGITAQSHIVAISERGRLCWLRCNANKWELSSQLAEFESYALLAVSSDRTKIALASLNGHVAVFRETNAGIEFHFMKQVCHSKILALIWLTPELLVTSEVGGILTMCLAVEDLQVKACWNNTFKDKGVSTAILAHQWLIVGDQNGTISVHDTTSEGMPQVQRLSRVAGRDGVTSLYFCSSTSTIANGENSSTLVAVGKDGRLHKFKLELSSGQLQSLSATQTKLGWLCGILSSEIGLLITAFYRENFSIWSLEQHRPLLEVPCGGGHRSWDVYISPSDVSFCFVREKIIHRITSSLNEIITPVIRAGLHWRVINCIEHLNEKFMVSGGDDGSVRMWCSDTGHQVSMLGGHLSSVRAILCISDQLIISAGGRAQIIVWEILQNFEGRQLASHLLCEGEAKARTPWLQTYFKPRPDPETRYMDLKQLTSIDAELVNFVTACSDSVIRVFQLDRRKCELSLKQTIEHHRCCVLKLAVLLDNLQIPLLASAANDGHVALWNADTLELISENRVHQSGVGCLNLRRVANGSVMISSGGDDNCVTLSQFDASNIKVMWSSNQGHAAQVTGSCLLSNDLLVTTSSDQRIIVWQQSTTNQQWEKKFSVISTISDIQGITVWHLQRVSCKICIYGKGFEVFSLTW